MTTSGSSTITQQSGSAASAGIVPGMRIFVNGVAAGTVIGTVTTNVSTGTSSITMFNPSTGAAVNSTVNSGAGGATVTFVPDAVAQLGNMTIPNFSTTWPTYYPTQGPFYPQTTNAGAAGGAFLGQRIYTEAACTVASCTLTATSTTVTTAGNFLTAGVVVGHVVTAAGFLLGSVLPTQTWADGPTVTAVSATSLTLSAAASVSCTTTLTFSGAVQGVLGYDLALWPGFGSFGDLWARPTSAPRRGGALAWRACRRPTPGRSRPTTGFRSGFPKTTGQRSSPSPRPSTIWAHQRQHHDGTVIAPLCRAHWYPQHADGHRDHEQRRDWVISFGSAHGIAAGQVFTLAGFTPTAYNGTWTAASSVGATGTGGTYTITVTNAATPGAVSTAGVGPTSRLRASRSRHRRCSGSRRRGRSTSRPGGFTAPRPTPT